MVAALVIIGATACTESEEGVDKKQEQSAGVSFYATIGDDTTRAYIDDADGDKTWSTVWEEGDTLVVHDDTYVYYTFVCTDAATGKFTCSDSGAVTLVGNEVTIRQDYDKHVRDSRLGKKALSVWTTGVEFTQDATIQLSSDTSFFRYTYEGEGDVTLKLTLKSQMGNDINAFLDNGNFVDEITFSGIKGENFVPFWCGIVSPEQGVNATLSYAIDGVIVKQTTIKNISVGKVYNLGELGLPYETSEWAIIGDFDGSGTWVEKQMVTTATPNVFVVEGVAVAKDYTSMLVKKWNDSSWSVKYGGGIVYFNPGNSMKLHQGGTDISITKAGTYDFYFDLTNSYLYVVEPGVDYTTVSEQTVNGEEPKQEEPEVTEKVVYLKPNSNWTQSNARFAAYFWGGSTGEQWVSMTAMGDGTYEVHLPEGYDYGCNIIFCRMNPSTTANNWNNKWNQTSDLKTPTDGKNLYTVKAGTWDKGGGEWSVK